GKDVERVIKENFEPVWEEVRPAPIVRIDFGNGRDITRTLHGNIATYACSADGLVLDVLPGIYTPKAYLGCLGQFRLLASYADQARQGEREARLKDYHALQASALTNHEAPARFINTAGISKAVIEGGIRAMLVSGAMADGA